MKLTEFAPNKIVYTTRHVALKQEPITYLKLDNDGDLQVLGSKGADIKNAMLVALSQIIEIDKTVLKIGNIEIGDAYVRTGPKAEWQTLEQ